MKRCTVILSPRAQRQLREIASYIAARSSTTIEEGYIMRLTQHLLALDLFPERGSLREDGSRTFGVEGSATVHFIVRPARGQVRVLGVLYRGQALPTDRETP